MKKSRFVKSIYFLLITIVSILIIASILYFNPVLNSRHPNVVLITVDALRSDHLSCYGYHKDTTPNIDKLSQEGAIFSRAVSTATWTAPSILSILTSLYPRAFGMLEVGKGWSSMPINSTYNLSNILKENKYQTCFISSHYGLNKITGIKKKFDTFNCWVTGRDNKITDLAIAWLENNHNKPFFLWLHYMGPHAPYLPPPPYDMLYLDKKDNHTRKGIILENIPQYAVLDGITEVSDYIAQYDGEIAFTDEQIGILLQNIKRLGLFHKTVIILTADHGESLGEHNCYFDHGGKLYDTVLRVPLIILYSSVIPGGKIIKRQVSLVDIMPTVLDILMIKKMNKAIDGISLLPLILNKKTDYNNYVFSERFFNRERQIAVRATGWKLIYNSYRKEYELYNLDEDPGETKNIVFIEQERLKVLKQKLDDYINGALPLINKTKQAFDGQAKEELKSLGYLQ